MTQLQIIDYAMVEEPREKLNKVLRKELKTEYGIDGRRLDNFTLTAMKALAKIRSSIPEDEITSLISAASYFSIELLQNLIQEIAQQQEIKPLDFVATVGNAANYYLAKQFKLDGTNLFLGSSTDIAEKTLTVAELDLLEQTSTHSVVVIWQENEATRKCYAFLLSMVTNDDLPIFSKNILADFQELTSAQAIINI